MTAAAASAPVFSRPIDGSEKVAILLLALERSLASDLLQQFEPDELRRISAAADDLQPITPQDLEAIVEEFAAQFSQGVNFVGTPGEVRSLLSSALTPDRVAELEGGGGDTLDLVPVWQQLQDTPADAMCGYLKNEHPQTVTFVLSQVSSGFSARIVADLPPDMRLSVMRRMAKLKPVKEDVVDLVEATLHADLLTQQSADPANSTRARIADIINQMEAAQKQEVMASIADAAPEEASAIEKLLFAFEDIARLDLKARMTLFDKVPPERIVLALGGADASLRELVLSAMGARARRMVEAELASAGSRPDAEVAAARRQIAGIALGLAEAGEIEIGSGDV